MAGKADAADQGYCAPEPLGDLVFVFMDRKAWQSQANSRAPNICIVVHSSLLLQRPLSRS